MSVVVAAVQSLNPAGPVMTRSPQFRRRQLERKKQLVVILGGKIGHTETAPPPMRQAAAELPVVERVEPTERLSIEEKNRQRAAHNREFAQRRRLSKRRKAEAQP